MEEQFTRGERISSSDHAQCCLDTALCLASENDSADLVSLGEISLFANLITQQSAFPGKCTLRYFQRSKSEAIPLNRKLAPATH